MNAVIEIAVPVFGIGILGYLATRLGFFSEQAAEGLARFVFDWAVPFMLLRVLSRAELPPAFPWELLASFYLPTYSLYFIGMIVARRYFRRDFPGQVITGFSCCFGNSVLLGLPLTLLTFGESGAVPFFILLSVHGMSYFTVTTVLLEFDRNRHQSLTRLALQTSRGLVSNPIIIGLFAGVTLNLLDLRLPQTIDSVAESLQAAVLPCSLFSLGASLSTYSVAGQLRQTLIVVLSKNLLFPALVWLLGYHLLGLPLLWAMVATLLAAQPAGVNIYLFAQRYQTAQALATTTVFVSTVASLFTLSALLYFFQQLQ